MAKDYIPNPDGDFDTWQNNFVNYVIANATALGISISEKNELMGTRIGWNTNYANSVTAQNAARGAVESKNNSRDTHESKIRQITKGVQARPETTDAQREGMDITVPDTTPTPLSEDVVINATPPTVYIDHSQPRVAIVHFGDNPKNENENAKPTGINGAKIWYHMGGLPSAGEDWSFLADDTNSPYNHIVNNNESVTIAYRAQWFDKKMRLGPLGDPITVAISP